MVQVIYTFKQGHYPFGRGKQSEQTYMEYLLIAKDQQQATKYRQFNGMMKKLRHDNIMRLERVLKEEMIFHLVYEFHNKSLEQRLRELTDGEELVDLFVELENVFDCLVESGLKAQLYLEFMGVNEANRLKVWIKPDEVESLTATGPERKKIRKQLLEYYDTQRTRIHLQIEEIFENSQSNLSKKIFKNKQIQATNIQQIHHHPTKPKMPNFVIEGNTLVFLNTNNEEKVKNTKQDNNSLEATSQFHPMAKANHLIYQQRPISKTEVPSSKASSISQQQTPDISKMSVAEKVLYYKKLKQQQNSNDSNQIIVKDSSTSQHDLSKSSNDSNVQIKTQMINKNKIKIITSQEVQVQGNSDDDLEKLARQKLAKINTEKEKGKTNDSSTEIANKSNTSANSQKIEKSEDHLKQINSKIAQAKLKAKNILEKYCQKIKK